MQPHRGVIGNLNTKPASVSSVQSDPVTVPGQNTIGSHFCHMSFLDRYIIGPVGVECDCYLESKYQSSSDDYGPRPAGVLADRILIEIIQTEFSKSRDELQAAVKVSSRAQLKSFTPRLPF